MKYIIFVSLYLILFSINADPIAWHSGSIVLSSREVLVGKISVQPEFDIILFSVNDQTTVYAAHKVESLNFYDTDLNINRKFTTIQQKVGASLHYSFFEIVIWGEIKVLRRSKSNSIRANDACGFSYYIKDGDTLITLFKFRDSLFPKLIQSSPELLSYMKEENLNPNLASDTFTIIQFYNRTFQKPIAHL